MNVNTNIMSNTPQQKSASFEHHFLKATNFLVLPTLPIRILNLIQEGATQFRKLSITILMDLVRMTGFGPFNEN